MLDFGGLLNRLLFLQHLTNFLPKKLCLKKNKSILRLPNFTLIAVCKTSGDKNGYLSAVLGSFPMEAAWSLLCQNFFFTELKPEGYCMFS